MCLILCSPIDWSSPGSSVHEISQGRILEWVAISSSRGSSRPRDQTLVSCVFCFGRQILYHKRRWQAPVCVRVHFLAFYSTLLFSLCQEALEYILIFGRANLPCRLKNILLSILGCFSIWSFSINFLTPFKKRYFFFIEAQWFTILYSFRCAT